MNTVSLIVYPCPICGFDMEYPPKDYHICPHCMTEFGYDDHIKTWEELRNAWRQSTR